MLQQILKDMYIDPDVLEALNEEQKKTLFLKMRQEQVRRWKEHEEMLEREGGAAQSKGTKPRNANSKSVSWLLGRDGDVSVLVIGEVDELTSKFINSAAVDKKSPPSLQDSTHHQTTLKSIMVTQEVKSEGQHIPQKTQAEVSLNLKQEKHEETSTLRPLPLQEQASGPAEVNPVSQAPLSSRPPTRSNAIIVRPAFSNPTPGCINARADLGNLRLASSTPSSSSAVQLESTSASTAKGSVCSEKPQEAQDSQVGKDIGALGKFQRADSAEAGKALTATAFTGRGRVAHLMKNFSVDNPGLAPSRGLKPPLPTKPDHLRLTTSPSVR
ncbi:SH2 domain-containing protein 4A isoform X1 [Gambusia affinis]|uniref:SH2 domain-containing protein 4A isoform X1 n=1 Tax=Gambusia affinis TaxID=33528 RepID=UPI001CDC06B8|nr:SH2 domain-containing protein 4A isoform X1 [Gambusia affinis]XP_043995800.1 SH2 domain-containing protein 4A isoform X1 [Gambusia affinis]